MTDHQPSTSEGVSQPSALNWLVRSTLDNLPIVVSVYEIENRTTFRLVLVNQRFLHSYNATDADVIGKYLDQLVPPTTASQLKRLFHYCMDTGSPTEVEDSYDVEIGRIWATSHFAPMRNDAGQTSHIVVTWEDITERKERELAEQQHAAEIIHQQATQLAELSTPLLSIGATTMLMPLIGAVDSSRVREMMQTLLNGIATYKTRIVILDVTGVIVIDTEVANALIQASQAVQLLGAQVILTGIRPEVAQSLVGIGVDLGTIITRGTLQDGIAYALRYTST